jgi:hypothetical protein
VNISTVALNKIQAPRPQATFLSRQGAEAPAPLDQWSPSSELSEPEESDRASGLSSALLAGFGVPGISEDQKLKRDLVNFEDRLPTDAKETYKNLDQQKRIDVMRLGKVFPGSAIGDSPLIKLMQDGRLFEKDSSGSTPLQRVTEAAQPDRPDFSSKGNFVYRVLKAVENPTQSRDAMGKDKADDASVNPADFIRKAGDEYNHETTGGRTSSWDDEMSQG